MPLYEYECDACGQRFEVIRRFSDPPLETCSRCHKGPVRRLLSSPAIQFKGTGWYITDYAQKGKTESGDSPDAGKRDSTSSETKASDTKSADGGSSSPTAAASPPAKTASTES